MDKPCIVERYACNIYKIGRKIVKHRKKFNPYVIASFAPSLVFGAMAERTKFISYCIYSVVISLIVYPIEAHWVWGGGWLSSLGFHDFAGSAAIHYVGGLTALIGAWMLGPRIGKFDKDGSPRGIPGHSLTIGALGCFILWFGDAAS